MDFDDYIKANWSYDPETGLITYMPRKVVVSNTHWTGYIRVRVKGKMIPAHRMAFLLMTGKWPVGEVDHLNRSRSDNRWYNLKDVTASENVRNSSTCDPKDRAKRWAAKMSKFIEAKSITQEKYYDRSRCC